MSARELLMISLCRACFSYYVRLPHALLLSSLLLCSVTRLKSALLVHGFSCVLMNVCHLPSDLWDVTRRKVVSLTENLGLNTSFQVGSSEVVPKSLFVNDNGLKLKWKTDAMRCWCCFFSLCELLRRKGACCVLSILVKLQSVSYQTISWNTEHACRNISVDIYNKLSSGVIPI